MLAGTATGDASFAGVRLGFLPGMMEEIEKRRLSRKKSAQKKA